MNENVVYLSVVAHFSNFAAFLFHKRSAKKINLFPSIQTRSIVEQKKCHIYTPR